MTSPDIHPNTLPIKDKLAWLGYGAVTLATLGILKAIGVDHTFEHLGHSFAESTKRLTEGKVDFETLRVGAMGLGFVIGVADEMRKVGKVKNNLAGHAELKGNGVTTTNPKDGVLEQQEACGDKRLPRMIQQFVELGNGYRQGPLLRNTIAAAMLSKVGDNAGLDVATGYFIGRAFPEAAGSTLTHLAFNIGGWGKPAMRRFEHRHDAGCGMTAADNCLNYNLKFDSHNYGLLDAINWTSSMFNFPMMAMEQTLGFFISGGRRIRYRGEMASIAGD